jgi:hypothetical protein
LERFFISILKLPETNTAGKSKMEEKINLKAATTRGGASASFTNEAANEIETIPVIKTNFVFKSSVFKKIPTPFWINHCNIISIEYYNLFV